MPRLTDIEDRISKNYISDSRLDFRLSSSLILILGAVERIWANIEPSIGEGYTNHGIEHSERVADFVEKLLKANPDAKFSQNEIYLLLAGIYLHDIGMKCNIVKYPEVKKRAEDLGAKFDVDFTAETISGYSLKEQDEVRKNHHYLSAAWIDYLYRGNDPVLSPLIKSIPDSLVDDLMDVCKFHYKLSINDCSESFHGDPYSRKKMVAALLRFADELDMSGTHVDLETVKAFAKEPNNLVYWWLKNYTVVSVDSNEIHFNISLHPEDLKLCDSFVREKYITYFRKKNKPVIEVLAKQKIPLGIDSSCHVKEDKFATRFPDEIIEALVKDVDPIWNPPIKLDSGLFIGRKGALSEIYEKLVTKNNKKNPRPLLISGEHGIGKTEITNEYAYMHRNEYKYIFWINSASQETLLSDFIKISGLLGRDNLCDGLEAKDKVRNWLGDTTDWLLIYYNVNDLPRISLVMNSFVFSPKGHIIIVSELKDSELNDISTFENFERVKIEEMTEEESTNLILKLTKNEDLDDNSEIEAVQKIAGKLKYIPSRMKDAAEEIIKEKLRFKEYYDRLNAHYPFLERPEQLEPSPIDAIERLYENSIYGARLDHFRPEKEILAGEVVKWIDDTYILKSNLKICLLIDSGTTTYQVFKEISNMLKNNEEKKRIWKERVCIVTNNLPGSQYLIINCRRDPNNQRSGTTVPCFLLPGKTLSAYAAIASDETIDWMSENRKIRAIVKVK